MAHRLSIQLCQILFHIGAFILKTGADGIAEKETCIEKAVNITCSDEEFVFFESAFFGRLNESRCYKRTQNEEECAVDVRSQLQTRFEQKHSVSFPVVADFLYKNRCPVNLPPSIAIAHRCVKAFEIKCGTNAGINEFPGIAEGRRLEIRCNLTFPRTYSAPLVQWLRDDVKFTVNLIENHNNISAEGLKIMWIFTAMLPLNASDDGAMFACVFTFKPSNVSNGTNNDEDYVYRWNYTAVVWHGPKDIWFEPNNTVYNYGEKIQCFADGNPPPIFTWNLLSGNFKQETNPILTLTEDLASHSNHSFQCTAFNSIIGSNISKVIDVRIESNSTESGCCVSDSTAFPIAGLISGIAVALLLLVAGIVVVIRCRGSRVHKEPDVVQTEDSVQTGGCSVEVGQEDNIEYLDLNGVKAIIRPSAFNQSEYASIDHTMKIAPTATKK